MGLKLNLTKEDDMKKLPRYEMGVCISCGDCNTGLATIESEGEWVKFEDIQQIKVEIAAILGDHFNFNGNGTCSVSNVSELGEKLRQMINMI